MSVASRHSMYILAEATFGTTPASPVMKGLRHTGCSLGLSKGVQQSEELRADRQIADIRHGVREVGGEIKGELSYGAYDDLLEAVLCGTWTLKAGPRTGTTISSSGADNSINDSGNLLPVMDVGDTVQIAGFTTTGLNCNGFWVVVSSTASKLVIASPTGAAFTAGTKAAGDTVTVTPKSYRVKNGTTRRSFSVLRYFGDISGAGTNPYHLFTGVEASTLTLEMGTDAILGITFSTTGKDLTLSDTAPSGSTLNAPATTTGPINSNSSVLLEAGVTIGIITEAKLTLENGMESRKACGANTVISAATIGRCNVSGEMSVYFENATMMNKFINETNSSIQLNAIDQLGNRYKIILPNVKYTGGQPDVDGAGEILLKMPFQAIADTATGATLVIDRCPSS